MRGDNPEIQQEIQLINKLDQLMAEFRRTSPDKRNKKLEKEISELFEEIPLRYMYKGLSERKKEFRRYLLEQELAEKSIEEIVRDLASMHYGRRGCYFLFTDYEPQSGEYDGYIKFYCDRSTSKYKNVIKELKISWYTEYSGSIYTYKAILKNGVVIKTQNFDKFLQELKKIVKE